MTEPKITFTDGEAYDSFMGRWSRAVGQQFLDWLTPPKAARWLDVGCGTGVLTKLIADQCAPAAVAAVDPAAAQIDHARQQLIARDTDFQVADASALPFPDRGFDVVVSALVINFLQDRAKGLNEMRRVARGGGIVAGFLWARTADSELSPTAPMQRGFREMGAQVPRIPGADMGPLPDLFKAAGLEAIETRTIDVTQTYRDFEDYWTSQTPAFSPAGKLIAKMPDADRDRLRDIMRGILPAAADNSISYSARANAIKARVPQ